MCSDQHHVTCSTPHCGETIDVAPAFAGDDSDSLLELYGWAPDDTGGHRCATCTGRPAQLAEAVR